MHDLDQRLADLGLKRDIPHHPHPDAPQPRAPGLASAFVSPQNGYHRFPSVIELRPQDSISMYRLARQRSPSAPSRASGRRGGTDVDGAAELDKDDEEQGEGRTMRSYATKDAMTIQSPQTEVLDAVETRTYQPSTRRNET